MPLPLIILICFFGIALAVVAVCLLVRDLVFSGRKTAPSLVERSRMLRRAAKMSQSRPTTLGESIDQGFDRLVLESGVDFSSLTAALGCIACGLMLGGLVMTLRDQLELALMVGAVGMVVPVIVLMAKRGKRMRAIREDLPQLLDLLSRSARAGRSLEQSLSLAAKEMKGGLGREIDLCNKQLDVGRSFAAVMKSFASRIRLMEVRILATTLIVQRTSGGNLPETLDRMSNVVRERIFARKRMKAATSAGRTSAILIAAICPIAYIVMFTLQPEHMSVLLTDSLGRTLLTLAVVLELIGVFWVSQLIKERD